MSNPIKLSARLAACAALVRNGKRLADVGCDHGYVSMEMIRRGIADRVIAADVRTGPLAIARANIEEAGLSERIETRLSDGLRGFAPGEVQAAVIAGMGGDLCLRILKASPEVLSGVSRLVLQPQSEIARVREEIFSLGFAIDAEDMVEEDHKFYMMFSAVNVKMLPEDSLMPEGFSREAWGSAAEYEYGRFLLRQRHPVLKRFLDREYEKTCRLLEELRVRGVHPERLAQLEEEQDVRREALSYYEMQ